VLFTGHSPRGLSGLLRLPELESALGLSALTSAWAYGLRMPSAIMHLFSKLVMVSSRAVVDICAGRSALDRREGGSERLHVLFSPRAASVGCTCCLGAAFKVTTASEVGYFLEHQSARTRTLDHQAQQPRKIVQSPQNKTTALIVASFNSRSGSSPQRVHTTQERPNLSASKHENAGSQTNRTRCPCC
jgi:hypothetical protein